jgi:AcrR family transcriptional regulator
LNGEGLQEIKRQAVLRTAARAFIEFGYDSTSLDDVAERLNVSKPSLYNYVKSKDAILFECKRIALDRIQHALENAERTGGNGFQKLCTFLRLYAEHILDDFGKCLVVVNHSSLKPATQKELREGNRFLDTRARALVQEGIADGSIVSADAKLTTFFVFGAFNWMCRWYHPEGGLPQQAVVDHFLGILEKALCPYAAAHDTDQPRSASVALLK